MKRILTAFLLLSIALGAMGAEPKVVAPYENSSKFVAKNLVDRAVQAGLRKRGIRPANPCSDEVFVRRVHLDLIGTLPTPAEVVSFLRDRKRNKRAKLIDALLERDEFAEYWSMKWCDLLRVKAEFPINLWPNGVQAYHRWIRDSVRDNRPYDGFVRELLTASGSNFRVPPVNFYRAVQSHEPEALAQAAALTFMGTRIEGWPEARRKGLTAFFSRVAFKRTSEWKEEIIHLSPAPTGSVTATFPDGTTARIAEDEDPRKVFADWLITPENPWFKRNIANRVWSWLMGRGIIHQPDDVREDNPPSNPALLAILEKELVKADWDLRALYRIILNSGAYQQSPIPRSNHPETEALFGQYIVRRLDAEVLIDALCNLTGTSEKYWSAIPEPFTFIPDEQRSIGLADGSITSPFLEMFGRPARDTGLESERNNESTDGQRLHLLNSSDIQRRIERSWKFNRLLRQSRGNEKGVIRGLYLQILSRPPTEAEVEICEKYMRAGKVGQRQAAADLAWALLNTKEFLYRH